eukprot:4395890-Amphidinium_carterae.1
MMLSFVCQCIGSFAEESLKHNLSEREAEAGKIRGETWMRTFSQGQSRPHARASEWQGVVLQANLVII